MAAGSADWLAGGGRGGRRWDNAERTPLTNSGGGGSCYCCWYTTSSELQPLTFWFFTTRPHSNSAECHCLRNQEWWCGGGHHRHQATDRHPHCRVVGRSLRGDRWRVAHWHRVTIIPLPLTSYEQRSVFLLLYDYRGGAASRSRSRISIRCVFASGDAHRPHRIVSIVYSLLNYYLYRFRRPRKTAETTFVYFCT